LSLAKLLTALAAFFCFSLTASSTYIFNDLADIEADRRHPHKQGRPFAAGDLHPTGGAIIIVIFLASGLVGGAMLPGRFFTWEVTYLIIALAYSLFLKRFALVDALVLSGLYGLRLLAGSAVTQTPISRWLAGCSIFLLFFLAIVERFAQLEDQPADNDLHKKRRR
jgi:4-hydroxybenzoate polyprenyltransferase